MREGGVDPAVSLVPYMSISRPACPNRLDLLFTLLRSDCIDNSRRSLEPSRITRDWTVERLGRRTLSDFVQADESALERIFRQTPRRTLDSLRLVHTT